MKNSFKYFIGGLTATLIVVVSASAATTFSPRQISEPQTVPVKGDLYVVSSTSITARLGVGTNGKCLTASSTAPYGLAWETCSSSSGISSLNGLSTSSITIQGVTNRTTVTTTTNSITVSTPQDTATSSSPSFNNLTASGTITATNGSIQTANGRIRAATGLYQNGDIDTILGNDGTNRSIILRLPAPFGDVGRFQAGNFNVSSSLTVTGTSTLTGASLFGNTLNASGTISENGVTVAKQNRAINTGTGLTGGGDLSSDRTISLNINGGSTQTCAGNNKVSAITATGTVTCSTDQTASSLKLPTITVASSSADFTSLAAAVIAAANTTNFPDGALLYLPDSSYTVTSTLNLANGVNITGNSHQTIINFVATSTGTANSPGSSLFAASGTIPGNIGISNLILNQSNGGYKGTALNLSNMSLFKADNIQSLGFKYAIYANDTQNGTFYNNITNWASFDDNCVYASSTNPVNDNTFINIRCGFNSNNNTTSTTYGLFLNNGQNNNFYNFNAEPAHPTGTIGISLTTANALSNSFFGLYAEANATSVLLGTNTASNNFFGGQICCHTLTSISDNGNRNLFLGLNDNFTGLASSTIPAPLYVKDFSANSITNLFQNNTNFAHINSSLVTMQLQNGSDTSKALQIKNAGTGSSLSVEDNSATAKFQVGNNAATSSVKFTVSGANTSLATTTVTSGGLSVSTTTAPTNGASALFRQNTSSTVYIGGASSAGCLVLGDSANGASPVYITATGSTLSATTTKPAACR